MASTKQGAQWITLPLGIAFFLAGYWIALELMGIANLQLFKVLNVIGICFDLAGLTILSKLITSNHKYKTFIAEKLAPQLANLFAGLPTGMVAASILAANTPSQLLVRDFSIAFQLFLSLPIVAYTIIWIKKKKLSADSRNHYVNILGWFFLTTGLSFQLLAALQDLYTI